MIYFTVSSRRLKAVSLLMGVSLLALSQTVYASSELPEESRSSLTSLPSGFYERWATLQGTVEEHRLLFQEEKMEGEKAQGFGAFSLTRQEAITLLIDAKADEQIRSLAFPEIFAAFKTGKWPKGLQNSLEYKVTRRKYKEAEGGLSETLSDLNSTFNTQGKEASYFLEELKEEEKKLLSDLVQELKTKESQAREYCLSAKVFEAYVKCQLTADKRWLPYFPQQSSLLDALAYLTKTRFYIWQRPEKDANKLHLIHKSLPKEAQKTAHLLHQDGNSFYSFLTEMGEKDLLFQLSQKIETLEEQLQKAAQALVAVQARATTAEEALREAQTQLKAFEQQMRISKITKLYHLTTQEEQIYQKFVNGRLIYKPNASNDIGKIELPIASLANPLEGTFDLSQCGNAGKWLTISTGYRKMKKAENKHKVETWFAPRFLVEKELKTKATHFKQIFVNWNETTPVGIFWTWGGDDDLEVFDYLTNESMDNLSKITLKENWKKSTRERMIAALGHLELDTFYVHFVN